MRYLSTPVILTLALPALINAATITVDLDGGADYTSIAPAIAAAITRDTVLIYPGYYDGPENSSLDFDGKDMVVVSVAGPESTTINGYMFDNVFRLEHGEDVTIEGLKLTETTGLVFVCNALGVELTMRNCRFDRNWTNAGDPLDSQRVAVGYTRYATAVFENCDFTDNRAGAIIPTMSIRDSDVTIRDCSFVGNKEGGSVFEDYSGVLRLYGNTSALIERCTFSDNRPEDSLISVSGSADVDIRDCEFSNTVGFEYYWLDEGLLHFTNSGTNAVDGCTFAGNSVAYGCVSARSGASVTITDCTFVDNGGSMNTVVGADGGTARNVELVRCVLAFNDCPVPIDCSASLPGISACCFAETGDPGAMCEPFDPETVVFADPLFCNREGGDYTLCVNSPCLVPNNDWGVPIGAHGWGCDACESPVEATSWGAIKAMFR